MPPDPARSVHALLRMADPAALIWEERPDWAEAALQRAPWVVVRRMAPRQGLWPVGIRGGSRWQRCAAWLPEDAVLQGVTPEMLVAAKAQRHFPGANASPARAALDEVRTILHTYGWAGRWGPCGSVGFELASTVFCTTPDSDLDLMLRADQQVTVADAAILHENLSRLPVRVDAVLETPHGAVSLAEYAGRSSAVLLRSANGPKLVVDPWLASPATVLPA